MRNAELGVVSDGISQIVDFQDNEYRSRVFSLVAHALLRKQDSIMKTMKRH